jgi:hypothetical protein
MICTPSRVFRVVNFVEEVLNEDSLDHDPVHTPIAALPQDEGAIFIAGNVQGVVGADYNGPHWPSFPSSWLPSGEGRR